MKICKFEKNNRFLKLLKFISNKVLNSNERTHNTTEKPKISPANPPFLLKTFLLGLSQVKYHSRVSTL